MFHMDNKDRVSRQYLDVLERILLASAGVMAGHDGHGEEDLFTHHKDSHGLWWLYTAPDLLKQHLRFGPGLSFIGWFAHLCENQQARYDEQFKPHPFGFLIGPKKDRFASLATNHPQWLTDGRESFEMIFDNLSKSKKDQHQFRKARSHVLKLISIAEGIQDQRKLDLFTERGLNSLYSFAKDEIRNCRDEVECLARRFQVNIEAVNSDIQRGMKPTQRSLSNIPDWQRACERLAAWMEVMSALEQLNE